MAGNEAEQQHVAAALNEDEEARAAGSDSDEEQQSCSGSEVDSSSEGDGSDTAKQKKKKKKVRGEGGGQVTTKASAFGLCFLAYRTLAWCPAMVFGALMGLFCDLAAQKKKKGGSGGAGGAGSTQSPVDPAVKREGERRFQASCTGPALEQELSGTWLCKSCSLLQKAASHRHLHAPAATCLSAHSLPALLVHAGSSRPAVAQQRGRHVDQAGRLPPGRWQAKKGGCLPPCALWAAAQGRAQLQLVRTHRSRCTLALAGSSLSSLLFTRMRAMHVAPASLPTNRRRPALPGFPCTQHFPVLWLWQLCEALKANTTVISIDLSDNHLTDEGAPAMHACADASAADARQPAGVGFVSRASWL